MEIECKEVTTGKNWKTEVKRRNLFGWRCYSARGLKEVTHHAQISENATGSFDVSYFDTEEKKTILYFKRERLGWVKTAVIYTLEVIYRITITLFWPFIAALMLSFLAYNAGIDPEMQLIRAVGIVFAVFVIVKIIMFILAKKIPSALGYDVDEQV